MGVVHIVVGLAIFDRVVEPVGDGETRDDVVYLIEVNPRASRTVPFVSKAIGVPLAKLAARRPSLSTRDCSMTPMATPRCQPGSTDNGRPRSSSRRCR